MWKLFIIVDFHPWRCRRPQEVEAAKLCKLILSFFAIFFMFGKAGYASQDIATEHINIVWKPSSGRKVPSNKSDRDKLFRDWNVACNNLGKTLMLGNGPWGMGVFTTYSCYRGSVLISGKKQPTKWILRVSDQVKDASLVIERQGIGRITDVTLPPSEYTFQFFLDAEFVDLLAYSLLDGLPMGMRIYKSHVKGVPPAFTKRYPKTGGKAKRFKYQVPPPPEALTMFRLARDESAQIWRSDVVGSAKQIKVTAPKLVADKKTDETTMSGGSVKYEIDGSADVALKSGPLWAQNAEGPGTNKVMLQPIIDNAHKQLNAAAEQDDLIDFINGDIKSLASLLLSSADSGYVGIRYGAQVFSGNEILDKTSFIGLLLEMRGGPAAGLRYYYDKVPKVSVTSEGANGELYNTSIEWSRHVLGYSFGLDLGKIISRVTVDPKLGFWNFHAVLPTSRSDEGKIVATRSFELGNTLSYALELGVESSSDWHILRGWYSIDSGLSFSKAGRVTSNRFGLDMYLTAGPAFSVFGLPMKTALLAFFIFEQVSLESTTKRTVTEEEDAAITAVEYSGGYAGGGIAISW